MLERVEHRAVVCASIGALTVDVRLELEAPWTVLYGPSGCGKTNILRAIAGLLSGYSERQTSNRKDHQAQLERRIDSGHWQDLSGMKPEHRGISYAPQSGALFPHLTVAKNISFAFHVCRDAAREATLVDEAMELFDLHKLSARMPAGLSGGEAQRVNLARAFARPNARLLLLDEPFAGLDRTRRDELLPRMQAWAAQHGLPVLSVTHDVDEALLLHADVLRMDTGKITAHGPAAVVLVDEVERMRRALF